MREISAEKKNTSDDKQRQWYPEEDQGKGQKLGTVTSFEYLRAVVLDDGFIPAALSRIAQATWIIGKTDALYFHFHISAYLWINKP